MIRVSVRFVPVQTPDPVSVSVAVNDPLETVGVNRARAGFASCVHVPSPAPPDHAWLLYVPEAVAPVIVMAANGAASHLDMLAPASTAGVWLQEIVRVDVLTMLPQATVPVKVRVAVNVPLATEGVNVASAGFVACCVQVPRPVPPDHMIEAEVPLAVAPVMAMGVNGVGVQILIGAPAFAEGILLIVSSAGADLKAQPP